MRQYRTPNGVGSRPSSRFSKHSHAPRLRSGRRIGMTMRPERSRPRGRGMQTDFDTIAQLACALRARETTSRAVTDRCLDAIAEKNSALNAFIAVLADEARSQADQADRDIKGGRYRGPLHGVPISVKDLIDLRG